MQVRVTWFVAFISAYTRALNLRPPGHLYFLPSLSEVSIGHSNAGARRSGLWGGSTAADPAPALDKGQGGLGGVGKGLSPLAFKTKGRQQSRGREESSPSTSRPHMSAALQSFSLPFS